MESSNSAGHSHAQSEALAQKYLVANITYPTIKSRMLPSNAAETLIKANQLSGKLAFNWQEIKNPKGGQCFLVFMSSKLDETPPDDLFWSSPEISNATSLPDGKILNIYEKFGGKCSEDPNVNLTRRRYFIDNKNPSQIQLLHYIDSTDDEIDLSHLTNSSQTNTMQSQNNQPIRPYLQPHSDYSNRGISSAENQNFIRPNGMPQYANQNPAYAYSGMDASKLPPKALPKRKIAKQTPAKTTRDTLPSIAATGMNPLPPPSHGDEIDLFSARDVALFRYKRNHDHLAELFSHKTQKTINKMKGPLLSASALSFFKQRAVSVGSTCLLILCRRKILPKSRESRRVPNLLI
ncbi:hypothetical protein DSO57_1013598 [Entomophthora muscae]|uniref:Uncharacterized protein n=1 Tax=Entomophthora muscae TaxID=34485 RepID=A0ACC2RWU5_9FUNG|nr:hypothetical protein DSO57_1013598 [Entomophthora muscae]